MKLRIAAVLTGSLAVAAALLLGWLALAARHVPAFYHEALQLKGDRLQDQSDRLVENAAALASNVRQPGRWHALFTADQINGWLAFDAARNFPELLPEGVADPRVSIKSNRLLLACRYLSGPVETVLSFDGEIYMQEPNVLSVRIHCARAGSLPAPLGQVLHAVSQAALDANLQLNWLQAEGDPVAIIRLHPLRDEHHNAYQLETLELRDGEIYVAGSTTNGPSDAVPSEAPGPLASKPDGEVEKR